jgi:spermidine/putrescine transport system substrate-binding protein
MSDTQPRRPIDPAFLRGMTQRRMTRRSALRYGGAAVGGLSLASILAACGSDNGSQQSSAGARVDFTAAPGDTVNFSNWPLYIDKAKDKTTGERYYPSLRKFQEETGITVNYNDEINGNDTFYGEIAPQLQAGQDIGRDIIVITNGQYLTALIDNGWLIELDSSLRPNFDANAASWAKSPFYDDGNRFSMAWQSGLTGVGYRTDKVNGELTSLDDLMDPSKVPPGSVGVLKEDAPNLVMINLGIDPKTSGTEEWNEAAAWLTQLRDSDTFRKAYDQGYVDDLTAGNLAATMAWSGDVLYYAIWEDYPFTFYVPDGGSLLWIDNMLIPANSANPQGAYKLMDFVYRPEIAQLITEWVLYMSPVPAVQALIAEHATQEKGSYAADLEATAENPLLWPDDAMLQRVSLGRNLETNDEVEEWTNTFNSIWE